MTAGNLCCGFFAVLTIFRGMETDKFGDAYGYYQTAIFLIFIACLFDLLDGRLARMGGQESPFGREFDSIADVVSFGMAPALLLSKAVLFDLPERIGWAVSFIYLLCGAMRLARFNCLALLPQNEEDKGFFRGIPIPMAAGFIASITFLLIHFQQIGKERFLGVWDWVMAFLMLALSLLMISNVKYPSFKKLDFKTKGSLSSIIGGACVIMLVLHPSTRWYVPSAIFSLYLLYGLIMHSLRRGNHKQES